MIGALTDRNRYPHPVERVQLIETHISYVLLTGRFAYKIKKPLDLGFLDFSTLAARRYYCGEELRLNRRFAPQLYLDVVAISGPDADPRMEGAGPAIEYALKMVEFPQRALLDAVLARGELLPGHIDELATALAAFHLAAARAQPGDAYGDAAHIRAPMEQNFAQLRPLLASAAESGRLDALRRWSQCEQDRLDALFAARHRAGFVRECHGDLHLGNIALVDGSPQMFDCIEFDPNLRWIDMMSELAFLDMDLAQRGRPDYAARVLNGYLEITGDYEGLRLLRYYLVYRALVRAKIARLRASQEDSSAAAGSAAAHRREYEAYAGFAQRVIVARRKALIVTHGLAGSGKTTYSQAVLEGLSALRLRSDVERKRQHGLAALARTGAQLGTGIYDEAATRSVYAELMRLAHVALEAGYPVIVDATFLERWQRDAFRRLAADLAIPFCILDCRAEQAILRQRIARRGQGAGDASEATAAVLERQIETRDAIEPDELADVLGVNTERQPPGDIVRILRERLWGARR